MTPASTMAREGSPQVLEMVEITPDLARSWLDRNTGNRRLNAKYVTRLAHDMKNGDWRPSHEGIAFGVSGRLLDGQHRLSAIVQSDVTLELPVWRNVPDKSLMVIDGGKSRSVADHMKLSGEYPEVTPDIVVTMRSMMRSVGRSHDAAANTSASFGRYYERHKDAIHFSMDALPKRPVYGVAPVRAVIARAYYSAPANELRRFCRMYLEGIVTSAADSAIVKLRHAITADNNLGGSEMLRKRYMWTQHALMCVLEQRQIKRLRAIAVERFPLPEEEAE